MSSVPPKKTKEQQILDDVDEVKGVMHQNINNMTKNMDSLDHLQAQTEDMRNGAQQFNKGANTLRKKMWWRNLKIQIIIAIVIIIILLIIGLSIGIPLANAAKKN